jgi:hypothetical protein
MVDGVERWAVEKVQERSIIYSCSCVGYVTFAMTAIATSTLSPVGLPTRYHLTHPPAVIRQATMHANETETENKNTDTRDPEIYRHRG